MADRVRSDALETLDATLVRHGPRGRLAVELPDSTTLSTDDVLRCTIAGTERFVRPTTVAGGAVRFTGAYEAPSIARSPGGDDDYLRAWLDQADLDAGRTVHVDVIEPGFKYGLRAPGETAVYDATESPDDDLASIAEQFSDP